MQHSGSTALTWLPRVALVIAGGAALGLLVVAATLDPDARGYGTHLQLGLQPCSIRVLFGIRCPACGMTTSWALATRGQIGPALQTNTGGVALALVALVGGLGAVLVGARGRWPHAVTDLRLLGVAMTVMAIIFTDWMIRLAGS